MVKDMITAVMNIITEVIVTRSIPKLNFVLSFAMSNENSPIESITMPENMLCSPLKFTKMDVNRLNIKSLVIKTTAINANIR